MAAYDESEKEINVPIDGKTHPRHDQPSEETTRTSSPSSTHHNCSEKSIDIDTNPRTEAFVETQKNQDSLKSSHGQSTSSDSKQNANEESKKVPEARPAGEDYSVLTPGQKKAIIMTASLASLFSPMATAIYCKS